MLKVADDVYSILDEWIIDSVRLQNNETGEIKESQIIKFNNIESFRSIDGMNNMYNLLNYNEESEPVMKKG